MLFPIEFPIDAENGLEDMGTTDLSFGRKVRVKGIQTGEKSCLNWQKVEIFRNT